MIPAREIPALRLPAEHERRALERHVVGRPGGHGRQIRDAPVGRRRDPVASGLPGDVGHGARVVVRHAKSLACGRPHADSAAHRGSQPAAIGPPRDPLHPCRASLDVRDGAAVGCPPEQHPAILPARGDNRAARLGRERESTASVPADPPAVRRRPFGQPHPTGGRDRRQATALQKLHGDHRLVELERRNFLHREAAAQPPLHARHARNPSVSAFRSRFRPMKIRRFARGVSPQGLSGR